MFSEYVLVAVFYILGIFISASLDLSAVFFLALTISVVGFVHLIKRSGNSLKIILLALILLFGGFRYFKATENKIYRIIPDKYVTATGMIFSEPQTTNSGNSYRYTLKPDTISYGDETINHNNNLLLYSEKRLDVGTKVRVSGFLNNIEGPNNEYEFDFSMFYKGKGIFSQIYARELEVTGKGFSLSPEFLSSLVTSNINKTLDNHFDKDSGAFLKAILTGNKNGFSKDYMTLLIQTGVYRVLYSPFIHISLIFFIASLFFRDKNNRNNLVLFLVILYALFNSASPTIIKASCLCGFVIFRKRIMGYADKLDILAKITLVMTVIDPLLFFNTGFVISVASTVILYFSYNPLYMRFWGFFKKRKLKWADFLAKTMSLWTIFLLGTLPLTAYLFSGTSVYATLFIILASPVIMAILLISPFMLVSFWLFGKSPLLAPIVLKLVDFVAYLPEVAQRLPSYFIRLKVPNLAEIVIFYLVWWIFIRGLKFKLKTVKTAIISIIALGIFLSGFVYTETDTLSVYFVNVGQGDGAILHTSRGETVLIDGGGNTRQDSNYNIGEQVFLPYLTSHGFSRIDVAILSHCHEDHAEGIIAAAEFLDIRVIVMPPTPEDNPCHQRILQVAKDKNIPVEYLSKGDEIRFDSGLTIRFLEPKSQHINENINDASLVAHISYGEFDALFTGDSYTKDYEVYPENVELLKVAHHGSDTSTSQEFLKITNPKCAVISVGKDNPYNLPSKEVLYNLQNSGTKILRTDQSGDIKIKAKKCGKFTYKTLKGD